MKVDKLIVIHVHPYPVSMTFNTAIETGKFIDSVKKRINDFLSKGLEVFFCRYMDNFDIQISNTRLKYIPRSAGTLCMLDNSFQAKLLQQYIGCYKNQIIEVIGGFENGCLKDIIKKTIGHEGHIRYNKEDENYGYYLPKNGCKNTFAVNKKLVF